MGLVVTGEPTGVEKALGATVNFQLQRIKSTSELEHALGVDVEASYGSAAFGAGVSARFSFAKNARVQTNSLFMTVTANIELGFMSIDDPALTKDASELIDRPDVFEQRFGNMFVRGVGRGGIFIGVLRIDETDSEESQKISAELEGSYGLFSAEAKMKLETVQKQYHNEIFVQMYHEGGPLDLVITDPTDPLQLLNNANKFLQSYNETPDKVARPIFNTLAPITIARGPLALNAADVEHAQDILVVCARRRSALLDQLNLLSFIESNPSRFDFTNTSLETIRSADKATQADLDILAECASAAINHPATAQMPADFAKAQGTEFPGSQLPDPLPAAKKDAGGSTPLPPIPVPDLLGVAMMSIDGDPQYANHRAQFRFDFYQIPIPDHNGDGDVREMDPPPGTLVAVGSTIRCGVGFWQEV